MSSEKNKVPNSIVDYLLTPTAIRERCNKIFDLSLQGKTNFNLHLEKLPELSEYVLQVIYEKYPSLDIPFHSRWGHFQPKRLKILNEKLSSFSNEEKVKSKLDLAIVSVLLDAGSGPNWKFNEPITRESSARSEGLAIASFHMFMNGDFSSDKKSPYQVDAKGLQDLSLEKLNHGFQVSPTNPLAGIEGRLALLQKLGKVIEENKIHFEGETSRPGNLFYFYKKESKPNLLAKTILKGVLLGLGPIWPGRLYLEGINLGDVWSHSLLGEKSNTDSFVPFHKLSQWLSYSLIEPLIESGLNVEKINELTGLAEYRNGGLILDSNLISLKDKTLIQKTHRPESELIIEWRALTICFLDLIAEQIRKKLGKSEEDLPLAKVLEGGTWWAGRKIAASLREDGSPPFSIESDGTVF